jgi:hypothetical protein
VSGIAELVGRGAPESFSAFWKPSHPVHHEGARNREDRVREAQYLLGAFLRVPGVRFGEKAARSGFAGQGEAYRRFCGSFLLI